jgi:hypothetical protein
MVIQGSRTICWPDMASSNQVRAARVERAFDLIEQFGDGIEPDARPESA